MRFALGLLLVLALPAQAYIPPPSFILSQVLKNHEGIKNLWVEGKITDLRSNSVLKETMRIDFMTGKLAVSYVGPNEEALGGQESAIKDLHRLGKFWITFTLDPQASRFKQALSELNILPKEDTEAKLSRIGNQVSWSWGDADQIQVLKDEFVALDYRVGPSDSPSEEIYIKDYSSSVVRIPRNVWVKLQNKDAYRYELKAMKINQNIKSSSPVLAPSSSNVKEWLQLVR